MSDSASPPRAPIDRMIATGPLAANRKATKAAAAGGPFIINSSFPPVTLDPHRIAGIVDPGFIKDLYSTLLQYDQKPITGVKNPAGVDATRENQQKIIPYLAQSYTISDDGKSTEFQVICRIDTPAELEYYNHGGILEYVLRQLLSN